MEEWQDAYRTSNIIFYLINKKERSDMKQCLESFYTHLAKIFWKSGNHLFHTYALLNLLKIVRTSNTKTPEQKQILICQLVLSALSIPLNNKISNFERLSTSYVPKDLQYAAENSEQVKEQILSVSSMLQI